MPMDPGKQEWEQMLGFAEGIAREGGAIAMKHYGHADPEMKYDQSLVTEADLEVQAFLEQQVLAAYPHHHFFGEG